MQNVAKTSPLPPLTQLPPFNFNVKPLSKTRTESKSMEENIATIVTQNSQILQTQTLHSKAFLELQKKIDEQSVRINTNSEQIANLSNFSRAVGDELGDLKVYSAQTKPTSSLVIYNIPVKISLDDKSTIEDRIKHILRFIDRGNMWGFLIDIRQFSPPNAQPADNSVNYVLEFASDFVRDAVMRYYHAKRKQLKSDLTYEAVFKIKIDGKIVFRELRPTLTHKLLQQAAEVKKAKNWHGAWQSQGHVYVRKTRDSDPILIYTPSDLRCLD